MNCCGHDHDEKQHDNRHAKHIWMMALCCGIPVLILLLLPLISGSFPGVSLVLGSVAPFLCPVMMVGMMLFMQRGGGNKNGCDSKEIKRIKE